jgi:ligand-binding SRPBCC domain-containing protein
MTRIEAINLIDAPIEACFGFSLSIDLELAAGISYGIEAIGGVTTGTIGPGERVTWRAKQFGVWVKHTTEITRYEAPAYFQDSMMQGLFRFFQHDHFFRSIGPRRTEMRDQIRFGMPVLLLGMITERLVVKRRLTAMLLQRNTLIRQHAEAEGRQHSTC